MSRVLQSAEFRLVAACCRPRALADFDAVVCAAAARPFDADLLLATARAHRVEGFVEDGLRRAGIALPTVACDLLTARAARARQQMLRNAAEEVRVARQFRAAGIEPLFVKGATLAMIAHGSLALKTSWDIDLLVAPDAVADARRLLGEAGYRLDLPGIDDPRLIEVYFARNKETLWINEERNTALELHSALVDAPPMLRGVGTASPAQSVAVAKGQTLTTLGPVELFAYLCVHGTSHRWGRLKWLTDVAALVARDGAAEYHEAATRLGAGRSAAVALRLCDSILALPLDSAVADRVERNRASDWLIRSAREALATGDEFDHDSVSGLANALTKLRTKTVMVAGIGPKIATIGALLDLSFTPERLAVPQSLLRLHALIWAPYRLLTRPWRKRQSRAGKTASTP